MCYHEHHRPNHHINTDFTTAAVNEINPEGSDRKETLETLSIKHESIVKGITLSSAFMSDRCESETERLCDADVVFLKGFSVCVCVCVMSLRSDISHQTCQEHSHISSQNALKKKQ